MTTKTFQMQVQDDHLDDACNDMSLHFITTRVRIIRIQDPLAARFDPIRPGQVAM